MRKLFAAIGRRRLAFAAVLVAIAGGIAAAALAIHHGPSRTTTSVALRPPAQPATPARTAPSHGAAGHRLRQHPAAKLKHPQPAPKPHPKRASRSRPAARAAGAQHPRAIPASAMRPIQVPAPQIAHVAYFVSPSGSDRNPGTSPQRPWRTVARVNRAHLVPGDGVLFQGGQRFSDAGAQALRLGCARRSDRVRLLRREPSRDHPGRVLHRPRRAVVLPPHDRPRSRAPGRRRGRSHGRQHRRPALHDHAQRRQPRRRDQRQRRRLDDRRQHDHRDRQLGDAADRRQLPDLRQHDPRAQASIRASATPSTAST